MVLFKEKQVPDPKLYTPVVWSPLHAATALSSRSWCTFSSISLAVSSALGVGGQGVGRPDLNKLLEPEHGVQALMPLIKSNRPYYPSTSIHTTQPDPCPSHLISPFLSRVLPASPPPDLPACWLRGSHFLLGADEKPAPRCEVMGRA
eukprot:1158848-Pelagomonas_calceolata.AAC.4